MKRALSLILLFSLSLIIIQTHNVQANIRPGNIFYYSLIQQKYFTYEGESFHSLVESSYFLEILYIEEDKIGIKQGTSISFYAVDSTLISKNHSSHLYPDYYSQPYFLDKDDFGIFYTHWIDDGNAREHVLECTAEDRVFTFSAKDPNYNYEYGYNTTNKESREPFYDEGEYFKSIRCSYTKNGVLSHLKEEKIFNGTIVDHYYLEELSLTTERAGSGLSIFLISCSLIIISSVYMILKKRRLRL